ncbi:hypothetical protein [Virgibacillus oceani]|uniref:Uncharacterized protein n=1 Tax=Virgibacillus oceani TaxID=1479511 RepID=A0A917HAI5_9BACI|nr:hypothetical protein [Virgibacillus oceani]GGG73345.1 hypothetical protein GCM10011398_17240 [Virgibacillus oceani]
MIIHEPEFISERDSGIIRALFETNDRKEYLWFSVPKEYQEYLTYERGDAFLAGLLLLAMKNGQDIQLNFPVSERLYYTLTNYLINALNLAMPNFKQISILHNGLDSSPIDNIGAVGTGFSAGVDSFCTVYEHLHEHCPASFKLTHFTFHNVGSHGDFGGDDSRKLFKDRLQLVKPFADEKKISTIPIDSNLSEVLNMDFVPTHTIRNAAAVLALQKLFRYYYYSSGRQFKHFKLSPTIGASYDILTLNMLSTESLTFYSAGSSYSRVEKTKITSDYEPTYRYLNVCTSGSTINCSACVKCLRTMLTFDVMGKLKSYQEVFDIDKYNTLKGNYIAQVLATIKSDTYSNEIYQEMKRYNYKIPAYSYLLTPLYWLKFTCKKILKS